MDGQIEGVHFMPGLDPAIVARRLLAVNLSDLAAMGALPAYGFLALAAPRDFDHRRFFVAFTDACDEHGLELCGGDLSSHTRVAAVLTLLGSKSGERRWLRRDGARIGERIWLGGTIGEAAAGLCLLQSGAAVGAEGGSVRLPEDLGGSPAVAEAARRAVWRHLDPRPQLELGRWLGTTESGAAIDVSDGLTRDLFRICSRSGVGAEIELDRLPLAGGFRKLCQTIDSDWRRLALAGGEDYVLLFTLPGGIEPPARFACVRIGRVVEGAVVLLEDGKKEPLQPTGWDHLSP